MKVIGSIIYILKIYYSLCASGHFLPASRGRRSSVDVATDFCEPPSMGAGTRIPVLSVIALAPYMILCCCCFFFKFDIQTVTLKTGEAICSVTMALPTCQCAGTSTHEEEVSFLTTTGDQCAGWVPQMPQGEWWNSFQCRRYGV